jgi:putative tryptophan/tyrosine transport system substrate-binding protein
MERHGSRRSRRQLVLGTAGAGLVVLGGCIGPLAGSQPPRPARRVGALWSSASDEVASTRFEAFRAALHSRGYVDGQNISFEARFADGNNSLAAERAAELISLPVDLILAVGGQAGRAAWNATHTIPIVQIAGNLVDEGKAASYARPGGNITGLASTFDGLGQKRLQLLKETLPALNRVAVLTNGAQLAVASRRASMITEAQRAAEALGVQIQVLDVRAAQDFDAAFAAILQEHAEALFPVDLAFLFDHQLRILAFAAQNRLPAIYGGRGFAEAGGLMSYGPNTLDLYERAATYVAKILDGTSPADLPIELPMRFDFVANLKTAAALGITFSNEILLQVTEVIQ